VSEEEKGRERTKGSDPKKLLKTSFLFKHGRGGEGNGEEKKKKKREQRKRWRYLPRRTGDDGGALEIERKKKQ